MKSFVWYLLIVFCLYGAHATAQGIKKSEVQQEINDLKQDIKELEAEIADAKINYPEDVPELEKELAIIKKMLSSFEKIAGASTAPKPVASNAPPLVKPVYNSPIVKINLSRVVAAPKPGEDTDRLLWYKGKKINDTTLITTKAMVVQYQRKNNRIVAQPEKKSDPFQKMIDELEKTELRKDEMLDKIAAMPNGFLLYPSVAQTIEIYDDYATRYNDVVKNTIELPPLSVKEQQNTSKPKQDNKNIEVLEKLKLAKQRLDALPPIDNFPAPPEHDLSICGSCDKNILEKERKADETWEDAYVGKEVEIIQLVLDVYRQLALLGIDAEAFDLENNTSMYADFLNPLAQRIDQKNEILLKKYGKDVKRKQIILQMFFAQERQKALLGIEDGKSIASATSEIFSEKEYLAYFNEQAGAKNYNFVLNFAFHIGLERQKDLLGINSESSSKGLGKIFDLAWDYNRFNLSIDLDFIFEQKYDDELEFKATGNFSSKDKVYVSLFSGEECTWQMRMHKTDYNQADESNTSIPLTINSGTKTIRNEKDKLVSFSHSGIKDVLIGFPDFRINLCNIQKRDTAVMMPMNYPLDKIITFPKTNKIYKEEILPLANHIFIDVAKAEENHTQAMELAADTFSKLSNPVTSNPSGYPKLDDIKQKHELKVYQDKQKEKISKIGMNKESIFLFNANNGSTVFLDQTNDTKHTIDEYTKLVKGQIHLRVVHEPINKTN